MNSSNIDKLWNRARNRLKILDEFETNSELEEAIMQLTKIRNRISHDYTSSISKKDLDNIREQAEKWRKWFTKKCSKYQEKVHLMEPKERVEMLIIRNIEFIGSEIENKEEIDYTPHYTLLSDVKESLDNYNQKLKDLEKKGRFY